MTKYPIEVFWSDEDEDYIAIVTVREPIPADWKVLQESYKHEKTTSNTAVWKVVVPAEGDATLSYRVQVRY